MQIYFCFSSWFLGRKYIRVHLELMLHICFHAIRFGYDILDMVLDIQQKERSILRIDQWHSHNSTVNAKFSFLYFMLINSFLQNSFLL